MFHVKHHPSTSPFNTRKITKLFDLCKFLTNKKPPQAYLLGAAINIFETILLDFGEFRHKSV